MPGLPFARRLDLAEATTLDYDIATGVAFVDLPGQTVFATGIQAIVLSATQDITIRLANQTDQGALLKAGGIFAIADCVIANVKIQNNSGVTAHIRGVLFGA